MRKNLIAAAVAVFCVANSALAIGYFGHLDMGEELDGTGAYAQSTMSVSYKIYETSFWGTDCWYYEYRFSGMPCKPDLSHFIISTSPSFSLQENVYWYNWWDCTLLRDEFAPGGSSNPNMPAGIDGVKFDDLREGETVFYFYSDRDPVWGDIYGKGGSANDNNGKKKPHGECCLCCDPGDDGNLGEFWNTGLAGGAAKIRVPDTTSTPTAPPVPEPATVLTGLAGIGALMGYLRKRR